MFNKIRYISFSTLKPKYHFSAFQSSLLSRLRDLRPEAIAKLNAARSSHGNKEIQSLTLKNVLRGLRDVRAIFYDSAYLDQKSVGLFIIICAIYIFSSSNPLIP
jgi:citrate synthase